MMLMISVLAACMLGAMLSYVLVDETEKCRVELRSIGGQENNADTHDRENEKYCA